MQISFAAAAAAAVRFKLLKQLRRSTPSLNEHNALLYNQNEGAAAAAAQRVASGA